MLDNITHGITGIGIGYMAQELLAGPQPGLILCAFLASQFPDIDVVVGVKDKNAYLKHHRGFSHSLLLAPFYGAAIAGIVKLFVPQTSYWQLFLVSILSLGLHLFLDLLNAYGTKLFWPISNKRFAWDILMIVDPLIIGVFALGIGLYVFNGQEGLLFAIFPFLGLYLLAMFKLRLKARHYLQMNFNVQAKLSILPPLWGWHKWNFIVEDEATYFLGQINIYTGIIKIKERLNPEKECNLVLSTLDEPEVQVFLDFARFPWHSIKEIDQDVVVKWSDLRYRLREREHFCLIAKTKE